MIKGYFSKKMQAQFRSGLSGTHKHPVCDGFFWLNGKGEKLLVTSVVSTFDPETVPRGEFVGVVVTPVGRAHIGDPA